MPLQTHSPHYLVLLLPYCLDWVLGMRAPTAEREGYGAWCGNIWPPCMVLWLQSLSPCWGVFRQPPFTLSLLFCLEHSTSLTGFPSLLTTLQFLYLTLLTLPHLSVPSVSLQDPVGDSENQISELNYSFVLEIGNIPLVCISPPRNQSKLSKKPIK
jgi:hypothetical protein